jgi:hypothetical protein
MKKQQSQARKQRRLYEAYLKKFHPAQYKEWKAGVIARGKKIHEANVEAANKYQEEYFEKQQTKIIQDMRAEGKTNEEIDAYINDWVQTLKIWGSSERPKRWREIRRDKVSSND